MEFGFKVQGSRFKVQGCGGEAATSPFEPAEPFEPAKPVQVSG